MSEDYEIELLPFRPEQAEEVVAMWRPSFEKAVGVKDPHLIAEQREALVTKIATRHQVRVAIHGEQVVGFVAASADTIAQLYVHVDYQGRGIGSRMLDWAKRQSSGSLWLYTFESNRGAQRFYERRGFRVIERGFEAEWQLNDIKYAWTRSHDPSHDPG